MNKTIAVVISLFVALGLTIGAFIVLGDNDETTNNQTNQEQTQQQEQETEETTQNEETAALVVEYTDEGFSPQEGTVKAGETVRFENNSTRNMWVASNEHPAHTENPNFDQLGAVAPGESWSYVFDTPGTYDYHNHLAASHEGTIVVE